MPNYLKKWMYFLCYATMFAGAYILLFRDYIRVYKYRNYVDFGEYHQIIGLTLIVFGYVFLRFAKKKLN